MLDQQPPPRLQNLHHPPQERRANLTPRGKKQLRTQLDRGRLDPRLGRNRPEQPRLAVKAKTQVRRLSRPELAFNQRTEPRGLKIPRIGTEQKAPHRKIKRANPPQSIEERR